MAKITKETVEKVAKLAALKLEPAQLEKYTKKFVTILEYIEELNKIDTKGIEPTSHAEDVLDMNLREDICAKFDAADMIASNFPRREGNLNAVPKVIESE